MKTTRENKHPVICALIMIGILVFAVLIEKMPEHMDDVNNITAYRTAEKLIAEEKYADALNELGKINGSYQDSNGLEELCRAHQYEAKGEYGLAYACLYKASFRYQDTAQMQKINIFKARMEQGFYREVESELEEERKAEAESTTDENKKSKNKWLPSSGGWDDDDDPYDASDYSHPDDFYYDHYDDFYDFEEAEEYYEEHYED